MKHIVKYIIITTISAFLLFSTTSCDCNHGESDDATVTEQSTDATTTKVILCGSCGEVKGSADCCKEGKEICSNCGLHKKSMGCCKMEKGQDEIIEIKKSCSTKCKNKPCDSEKL